MLRRPVAAVLIAFLAAGCIGFTGDPTVAPTGHVDPTAPPVRLTVFAASSLKGALEEAKRRYETFNEVVTITLSTDSSAALEAKIEQGAPADVFLSADTANPARLRAGGFADGDPVDFAGNTLLIIVPTTNPGAVTSPFDLAKPGLKVIAAGDTVPVTTYATQLVRNLAALPNAPAGFEAAYAANVVSKEDNVKAVVAKMELGEGDAAIVYATDAIAPGKVTPIPILPASANVTATYAGVVVKASANREEAAAFLAWLAGPDGQEVFTMFGFLPAPG